MRHAVVSVSADNNGRNMQMTVVTPWSDNRDLVEAQRDAMQEQAPPRVVYGVLSLPRASDLKGGRRRR